jgi:hypothetical protein
MRAADTLRTLIAAAERGGCDSVWLSAAADELVQFMLDAHERLRLIDPRRLHTLKLARRVANADASLKRNGTHTGRIGLLADQFGLSKSRIHALLKVSRESQDC